MVEVKDGVESRQKAEYVSHTVNKRGRGDYLEITYKRLDGDKAGTELKAGNFIEKLDEASKNLIKAKGQFVIVKTKQGQYWPLTRVEDVNTFIDKARTTSISSNTTRTTTSSTAGVKVGAVLHDAVALAGPGAKVVTVEKLAEELLTLSFKLENNVNNGKYAVNLESKPSQETTTNAVVDDITNYDF